MATMRQIRRLGFGTRLVLETGVCLMLCGLLLGCPYFQPVLNVSPRVVDFGATSVRENFAIANTGFGSLEWNVREVVWDPAQQQWIPGDTAWLSIDSTTVSGKTTGETDRIFLDVDRQGLDPGAYSGVGIWVTSDGGNVVVPVNLTVSGEVTPGEPGSTDVKVSPSELTIHGLGSTTSFTVSNEGSTLVHWFAEVTIDAPSVPAGTPVQVAAVPSDAVTVPSGTSTVLVGAPDPGNFNTAYLNYLVAIRNKADNSLLGSVRVKVDLIGPPAIDADPSVLDFGKDSYQLSFEVANVGDRFSILNFGVFRLVESATAVYAPFDLEADPLISGIDAPKGMSGVHGDPNDPWLLGRQVTVTISRDHIEQDLEYRDLYIGAVKGTDASGNNIMDLDIVPKKVQIRVEATPVVEGATNRSRPPSLMQFVFLLRDKRGIAVNAADEAVRRQMKFFITEDDFPLDPNESNQFVTGPENLKYNIVLLLDFTGSMYNAGVEDATNRLQPGEAIQQMLEASKQFILDLPDSYRVALMEQHDRNQPSRVIHGFDTNKAALLTALDGFTLPAAEHGASALYDALYDACQVLVNEDPAQALPFDEADVRSVIFVTDGWDTSSEKKIADLTKFAQDSRVRFYPVGYSGRVSSPVNGNVLIQLASDTGGHSYYAAEVSDLARLLDTKKDFTFSKSAINLATGTATLRLRNIGATTVTWNAVENLDWLNVSPASGTIPPLHRRSDGVIDEPGIREVTVTLASPLAPGRYSGPITINSDAGDAIVTVVATVGAGGALTQLLPMAQTVDIGRVWGELRGQAVLTYTSLFQSGHHTYLVEASFPDSVGNSASAAFQKDAIYYAGDVRAGQAGLVTTGLHDGMAEVFVRADYVPRDITQFRMRFILDVPAELTPNLGIAQRALLLSSLNNQLANAVRIAPGGLIDGWRLIAEGSGVFSVVTDPASYLPYGASGNLLKLTFQGLGPDDAFALGFRVDNSLYLSPATDTTPSLTKYFLYPGGRLNPEGRLTVSGGSSMAGPALTVNDFAAAFDPETPAALDRDGDGWADFDDLAPDDPNVH